METNKSGTSPKKRITLQEEIDSWQKEKWPPGFMEEQVKRNLKMIEVRYKK